MGRAGLGDRPVGAVDAVGLGGARRHVQGHDKRVDDVGEAVLVDAAPGGGPTPVGGDAPTVSARRSRGARGRATADLGMSGFWYTHTLPMWHLLSIA